MSEEFTFIAWQRRIGGTILPKQSVRVSRQSHITMSEDLFEQHFSLEFVGAEVFIDINKKAIGLKPSKDKLASYIFKKRGKLARPQVLYLKDLVIKNDVQPMQYPAKWSEKHGMVIFNYRTLEEVTK